MRRIDFFLLFHFMFLCLSASYSKDTKPVNPLDICNLPAPTGFVLLSNTNNYATLQWNAVPGAVMYKLNMTNLTSGMPLPSMFVPGTTGTYLFPAPTNPNDPVPTYQSTVQAICSNADVGPPSEPIDIDPILVIDDITQYSSPCNYGPTESKTAGSIVTLSLPITNPVTLHSYQATIPYDKNSIALIEFFIKNPTGRHVLFQHNGPTNGLLRNPDFYPSQSQDEPRAITYSGILSNGGTIMLLELYNQFRNYSTQTTTIDIRYVLDAVVRKCTASSSNYIAPENTSWTTDSESLGDEKTDVSDPVFVEHRTAILDPSVIMSVYPNPVQSQASIQVSIEEERSITMAITNAYGQVVRQVTEGTTMNKGEHIFFLDMTDFPQGVYYVTLQTNQGRQVSMLIKQ